MKKSWLTLIILVFLGIVFCGCSLHRGTIRIREIPGVKDWIAYPYDMEVVIKAYLIDNPPADHGELRDLAEKQIDDDLSNIESSNDTNTMYKCFFYRTSKYLPWNWTDNDAHMAEDHIYHHADHMIIAVYWTSENNLREYSIMKKSDGKDDYGDLLDEVIYEGDAIKSI